jgi:hypothetical protein
MKDQLTSASSLIYGALNALRFEDNQTDPGKLARAMRLAQEARAHLETFEKEAMAVHRVSHGMD